MGFEATYYQEHPVNLAKPCKMDPQKKQVVGDENISNTICFFQLGNEHLSKLVLNLCVFSTVLDVFHVKTRVFLWFLPAPGGS